MLQQSIEPTQALVKFNRSPATSRLDQGIFSDDKTRILKMYNSQMPKKHNLYFYWPLSIYRVIGMRYFIYIRAVEGKRRRGTKGTYVLSLGRYLYLIF